MRSRDGAAAHTNREGTWYEDWAEEQAPAGGLRNGVRKGVSTLEEQQPKRKQVVSEPAHLLASSSPSFAMISVSPTRGLASIIARFCLHLLEPP
eukprot:7298982-Prymnesium_polylepis.1